MQRNNHVRTGEKTIYKPRRAASEGTRLLAPGSLNPPTSNLLLGTNLPTPGFQNPAHPHLHLILQPPTCISATEPGIPHQGLRLPASRPVRNTLGTARCGAVMAAPDTNAVRFGYRGADGLNLSWMGFRHHHRPVFPKAHRNFCHQASIIADVSVKNVIWQNVRILCPSVATSVVMEVPCCRSVM